VQKNFDDVGCNFAQEALKIHYGAVEPRNIRGVSTKEEEKTLKEEGIEFFKVPMPRLLILMHRPFSHPNLFSNQPVSQHGKPPLWAVVIKGC